ncbi:MAG: 4-hydroxy-tetrahydrodipicolinate reductase [Candidatus Reconcilbacillus cellulovorans]|uniref:4-hydroxy-tetrahydrodipicolinate reductase n=1 Tax=Candidatus Reconcilbacillus cellulovorans TaxID=1906605 RepID=A0A2A6E3S3_9BACL|nr:MAG: 4-hydroxy-tetrahydrodipicolinate reductase [Candidatus Reconcilbacillus cellulovorans]
MDGVRTEPIRVAVTGACGRMGREVVRLALEDEGLRLVAAVDRERVGLDAAAIVGKPPCGVALTDDLELALLESGAEVLVDFTTPRAVFENAKTAIRLGVRPVIGTTGMSAEQIAELDALCRQKGIGGVVAPNFSIGAVLMMRFAEQAAKYFPHVEIIEYHGDQKLDAPSGTSLETAERIARQRPEFRQGHPDEEEKLKGARGGYIHGFRIHSVRLPGIFAQQEVVFGGYGQTLKIRHDSYDRAGYMPGVALAVRKVFGLTGIVYGFDALLD